MYQVSTSACPPSSTPPLPRAYCSPSIILFQSKVTIKVLLLSLCYFPSAQAQLSIVVSVIVLVKLNLIQIGTEFLNNQILFFRYLVWGHEWLTRTFYRQKLMCCLYSDPWTNQNQGRPNHENGTAISTANLVILVFSFSTKKELSKSISLLCWTVRCASREDLISVKNRQVFGCGWSASSVLLDVAQAELLKLQKSGQFPRDLLFIMNR